LHLYSRRLTTVEGNTTFYSVPDRPTVQRWAAETPPEFKFCLKLPKTITHQGNLAPRLAETNDFIELMSGLGDRFAPVFAQLPPSYSPAQWSDLVTFLQAFPHDKAQLALEVRHLDWFEPQQSAKLNALLQELGVGRVLLDTRPIYDCPDDPQLHSERRKPRVPLEWVVTANFALVRYISHPELEMNQPYLNEWVAQVGEWLQQGIQIYFFVHCPQEVRSPNTARHFQQLLEENQVPVPPLPWNEIEQPPAQLSLF
jgi:uncharacterized protein YecE (DUF72 family)